jgi:vancomycin resistance protein YoaR
MTLESLYDHTEWEEPLPPGRRRWPLVGGAVLLAVLAVYVAVAVWAGGRVPGGTTVAGVAVGGMSREEARATLATALGERASEPMVLASRAGEVETSPKALGLGVDVDASLEGLVGFSLSPVVVWHHLTGGTDEPAAVTVDEKVFAAAVEKARGALDAEPVEGSISVAEGKVSLKEPVTGTRTDVDGTADAVRRWWPSQTRVDVVGSTLEPKVSAAELTRVRTEFADTAVSGPVTVSAGGRSFQLTPAQFGPAVVLTPDASGRITPRPDEKKLAAVVHAAAKKAGAEVEAKDAVVTFSGRTPTVKPHVAGVALDDASLRSEVWKAIGGTNRTATVATKASEPSLTTARAKATLPKGLISTFTTYYPAGAPRVSNIKLAARVLNGTTSRRGSSSA